MSRDVSAYFAEVVGQNVKIELRTKGQHNYRTFWFTKQEWASLVDMVEMML